MHVLNFQQLSYAYDIGLKNSPFWSFAVHDGHELDPNLSNYMALGSSERLREEDPFTAYMGDLSVNYFVGQTSRFQLDINRTKKDALYISPDQAWGLKVWNQELPSDLISSAYGLYDKMYAIIDQAIEETILRFGYFVVYDVHSYNVLRDGPNTSFDKSANPEINIGTKHNHSKWQELTYRFIHNLAQNQDGEVQYDVRENVRFKGGYLSEYINEKYGAYGCVFSIEFRKDFMNEWTGEPYWDKIVEYQQALKRSLSVVKEYFAYEKP